MNKGHRKRLRERFLRTEFAGFSQHEVIELALTLSIPRRDVKSLAKELLQAFGSVRGVFDAGFDELAKVCGVGAATAAMFKIVRALNGLYIQECCEGNGKINSPKCAFDLWQSRLSDLKVEAVEIAYLDSNLCLMRDGIERLETGTASAAAMDPRKIAAAALHRNAPAVMVAHNHPFGAPKPSASDEYSTAVLERALNFFGIWLVDHIIVTKSGSFSFKKNGLLPNASQNMPQLGPGDPKFCPFGEEIEATWGRIGADYGPKLPKVSGKLGTADGGKGPKSDLEQCAGKASNCGNKRSKVAPKTCKSWVPTGKKGSAPVIPKPANGVRKFEKLKKQKPDGNGETAAQGHVHPID
jgi:DNA repair protein RadC